MRENEEGFLHTCEGPGRAETPISSARPGPGPPVGPARPARPGPLGPLGPENYREFWKIEKIYPNFVLRGYIEHKNSSFRFFEGFYYDDFC